MIAAEHLGMSEEEWARERAIAIGMNQFHRWVRHELVPDFLRCGWLALPTLDGTHHGFWSVHLVWLCTCAVPSPERGAAE